MAASRFSSVIQSRGLDRKPARRLRGQPPEAGTGLGSEAAYRFFLERFNIAKATGSQKSNHVIAEGYCTPDGSRVVAFHILRSSFNTGLQLLREGPSFRGTAACIVPCWMEPHRRKTVVLRSQER